MEVAHVHTCISSTTSVLEDVVGWHVDEAIRCLCAYRAERDEMVCCDACGSWSHLI